jgi:hypothetical protein
MLIILCVSYSVWPIGPILDQNINLNRMIFRKMTMRPILELLLTIIAHHPRMEPKPEEFLARYLFVHKRTSNGFQL